MGSSFKVRLREAANRILNPVGLHLSRSNRAFEMGGLLARAAKRGTKAGTIIDIGASDGSWSLLARQYFRNSRHLLFEPLAERRAALERLKQAYGFEIIPAAAGAKAGEILFHIDHNLDGSSVAAETAPTLSRTVPMLALDDVLLRYSLPEPFIIKLDTHGYEVPVLDGATRALARTQLLIVECYNFKLTSGCLRFQEICVWLEMRGFRCVDIADPMRRPGDGALWQFDLAFAPISDPVFRSSTYQPY